MLQQTDALFIPFFYDVQPWELRHIKNEKSQYGVAFSDYRSKGRYLDKLDEWKNALKSAADVSGYELSHSSHQYNLCENIVSRVLQLVQERRNSKPLNVAKYPVGLADLVQDFESCGTGKVMIAGIYGLGGSGKTTLAKELFNRKRSDYHAASFLSDVRESHANRDLQCLQSQLLKDLFPKDSEISSVHHGIGELKDRLGRARHLHFLIVLDDIDHQDQLDALLPEGMLSSSSLVIITTRDQSILMGADIRYKMKELNRDRAKELFCSHAFRIGDPPIAYEKLVESFVEFCGGLPLSLKILGAHLYGRDEYYWQLQLEKVKKIQPKDIMQRLKISFDGLDQEEKHIFIDIACLFNKKKKSNLKSKAILVWNLSGWSAKHAVQNLQDKCLIEASFELRKLEVFYSPSLQKLPDLMGMFRHLEELDISRSLEKTDITPLVQSLKQLDNLRSLTLSFGKEVFFKGNLDLSRGRDSLSSSRMNSLETIQLSFANISKLLICREICPRLRSLTVQFMENLKEMHLNQLERLEALTVRKCPKFETISGLSSLTGLPSLKVLYCPKWETIPGLSSLKGLQSLRVEDCPKFETISGLSSLTGLQVFKAQKCEGLKSLPTIAQQRHLERFTILDCHKLQSVEGFEELQGLKSLIIEVPDNGYAWVRNCFYGLRRLPSEYTILIGKPVDTAFV